MATPQPPKFNWLPLALFVGLVIILGALYSLRREGPARRNDSAQTAGEDSEQSKRRKAHNSDEEGGASGRKSTRNTKGITDLASSDTATMSADGETSSPPERTTEDPMGYVVHDFRNHQMQLAGFKLDNVVETEDGLTLGPGSVDEQTTDGAPAPRIGTIESPALSLVAASNLVAPNWKEKLPPDTNVQIELSCSADQNEWTEWFPISRGDNEPAATYPDGAPNPNYGNTPGTHVAFGLKLYPYVRYRVTMAATGAESPVFQQIRVFHTDGTGGNGVLANMSAPDNSTASPGTPPQ